MARLAPDRAPSGRDAIEARLAELGFRMEHSLDALDGEGHAVIEMASSECVAPPPGEVLALSIEWSLLEGAISSQHQPP